MYNIVKRVFDIFFSFILLIPLSVLMLLILILVKIEDGGRLFYKAERLGKNARIFHMYKFRSMKVNAKDIRNADGSTYNASNDSRVTKIGKILRETSLDEIPQIINILKGEMSFIGPRASMGNSINTFNQEELEKMKVRPGITGFTQAYYRNELTMREKRMKDVWYANNVSFLLDMKILIQTVLIVLKREGIYTK